MSTVLVNLRRRVAVLLIRVLASLRRSPLRIVTHPIIWVVELAPVDPLQKDSFFERLEQASGGRFISSTRVDIVSWGEVPAFRLGRRRENRFDNFRETGVLNIFLEPKADIPVTRLQRGLAKGARIIIHSFHDVSDDIDRLSADFDVETRALRDQFNDISSIGERVFAENRNLTGEIYERSVKPILKPFRDLNSDVFHEVASLALEDKIIHELSLLLCIRSSLRALEPRSDVLYVAKSSNYLIEGWAVLAGLLLQHHCWFAMSAGNGARARHFWRALRERMNGTARMPSADRDVSARTVSKVLAALDASRQQVLQRSIELGSFVSTQLAGRSAITLAHSGAPGAYEDTRQAFCRELSRRARVQPGLTGLIVACSGNETNAREAAGLEDELVAIDMAQFRQLVIDAPLDVAQAKRYSEQELSGIPAKLIGFEVGDFIAPVLAEYLRTTLIWVICAHDFGATLCEKVNLEAAIASPSRHWLVRAFLSGLRSSDRFDKPIIDVQSLNVFAHPKYRRPLADHCAVIDAFAAETYSREFGMPVDAIHVVGCSSIDFLRDKLASVSEEQARTDLGLPVSKPVLTFLSQLQPFETIEPALNPCLDLMDDRDDVQLVIRMHPRETLARQASYLAVVRNRRLDHRVVFSVGGRFENLLKASDACVTIYSNAARDAVIAGLPVIIPGFLDFDAPVDLGTLGMAETAATPDVMKAIIGKWLDGRGTRQPIDYLKANPVLLNGNSAGRLLDLVEQINPQAFRLGGGAVPPLLPTSKDASLSFAEAIESCLILEEGVAPADLPPLFSNSAKVDIVVPRQPKSLGFVPRTASVLTLASVEDQIDRDGIFSYSGRIADGLLDSLIDATRESRAIHELLVGARAAFWLRIRAKLIDDQKYKAAIRLAMDQPKSGALVLCCRSSAFARWAYAEAAGKGWRDDQIWICIRTAGAPGYNLKQSKPEPVPASPKVSRKQVAAVLRPAEAGLKRLKSHPALSGESAILMSIDWHLKTVPPTVKPLVEKFVGNSRRVVLANLQRSGIGLIDAALSELATSDQSIRILSPHDLVEAANQSQPGTWKDVAELLEVLVPHAARQQGWDDYDVVALQSAARAIGIHWIMETAAWRIFARNVIRHRGSAAIGCPGRQWHAVVAAQEADRRGRFSLTVQNAYMSEGYTYTRPEGRHVAAIDHWSKELLTQHFGMAPVAVSVTSTPRFDNLALLREAEPELARNQLGLTNGLPIVCLATQVGYESDYLKIAETLNARTDLAYDLLIKLHPRMAKDAVGQFECLQVDGASGRTIIVAGDDVYCSLLASNLVVTMFSNVGVESAILGRDVVIANFNGQTYPLPLDKFGIGPLAESPGELADIIASYFRNDANAANWRTSQERFRQLNLPMVEGNSAELISRLVLGAAG